MSPVESLTRERSASIKLAWVPLPEPGGLPVDGPRNWSSGWLPAFYQGTSFNSKSRIFSAMKEIRVHTMIP
jgi:hypothetical protein